MPNKDKDKNKDTLQAVNRFIPMFKGREWFLVVLWIAVFQAALGCDLLPQLDSRNSGLSYTNECVAEVPWSIHVVRVERTNSLFEIRSMLAGGKTLGLGCFSEQLSSPNPAFETPVAAINGDFFRTNKSSGLPRGLQIADGEVLTAPSGRVAFWIDAFGQPHTTNVVSLFHVEWPDGTTTHCGLNENPRSNSVVIYTSATAHSIHAEGGRELILERTNGGLWLPLTMGETFTARVGENRSESNITLVSGRMILSLDSSLDPNLLNIKTGAVLRLSTASLPDLRGVKTAIGGGPVLLRDGVPQKIQPPGPKTYTLPTFPNRHPRSAIGWNEQFFYLVEVDGRQKNLSAGMTLEELSAYMLKLGCDHAMNLDGGGSSALWFQGKVRNRPSDGHEREIANFLVVVKKKPKDGNALPENAFINRPDAK